MPAIRTAGAALVAASRDEEQLQINKWASRDDWERFRSLIKRLYVDEGRTLKDVMAIMLANHGHNATKRMYKSRIQKWKLDKNNKLDDMLFLRHKNKERRGIQKSTMFHIRGQPVDWDDVQRYFKRKKEGEKLLASSRYVMSSTPPHIEYRTPSPPLSHSQYAPSPRSLAAPQDTATPEQLFYNINVYMDGSFRSGNWVPGLDGGLISLKAEANRRRFGDLEFHSYSNMAADLVERSLFVEARRVLSLASGAVVDIIRRENPRSLHFLFSTIVSLLRRERVEIVVMFQKYIADVASKLVPVGHPWGEIFRVLGTININQLADVSIQSWKCFNTVYGTNLGRYNQDTVYCYAQYVMQSIGNMDAERLLRRMLADCGRVWGMTAFMTIVVMYYLVDNLILQQNYVDAEKLAFDLLTRAEASSVRAAMEGAALELMADAQYLQGKRALAETNMRSSILHEDGFRSGKGCPSIRLRIILESWLRDWNRETDADEVKAEIDQLIGEDEIDREGRGCES